MKRFRLWLYTKYITWHYSRYDAGICCCGQNMDDMYPGLSCNAMCRSLVEYCIALAVDTKRKELGL